MWKNHLILFLVKLIKVIYEVALYMLNKFLIILLYHQFILLGEVTK